MEEEKKAHFEDFINSIIEKPVWISIIVLFVLSLIVIGLSIPLYFSDSDEFLINLLGEAHGMIFDIAVIGILIFWLNDQGQKRQRIRTYKDEIDDFRMWESEEAAFRTAGNIKRLNRHKIYNLNLYNCYLVRTNLNYVNLVGANINNSNISNSNLSQAKFEGARLNRAKFENSNLNQVNFVGAFASGAIFRDANMIKANLQNSFLIKADFYNAFLMESNLNGAHITGANFDKANLYKADLRNAIGLSLDQFENVKTLYLAQFDEPFFKALKAKYPDLVGK